MPRPDVVYRPPETDSEDDYDGFYFGDDIIKKEPRTFWVKDVNDDLYDAAVIGDVEKLRQIVDEIQFDVNKPVKTSFTLLLVACTGAHLPIVEYLVEEKGADVNAQIDSTTALMCACNNSYGDKEITEKLVKYLLKHNAVINVSDKFGTTPLMIACRNGYTGVVRLMIEDASLDVFDNEGFSPLILAIENNNADILKMLIDAGANTSIVNGKGYTPQQVAEFHGFYDLLDILPREKKCYVVPTQFLGYNTLRDHIPCIFLKSECPEYFQEVNSLLSAMHMRELLKYFAKARTSLSEFLTMNDEKLAAIGIELPFYRAKIMKGLLDFHLHHWSKKSIARVSKSSKDNFYEILMLTANQLQHLTIVQSSLKYVAQNVQAGILGEVSPTTLEKIRCNLKAYRSVVNDLNKTTKYLASFSPSCNALYIDYDEICAKRKRQKILSYFKYTGIVLGISVFVCVKIVKHGFST